MNLIVAVDKKWGIGYNNDLLVSIPADKKRFRQMTLGKTIIMGRRTMDSFPNGIPLSGRTNIVITSKISYDGKGAIVVHSAEEAVKKAHALSNDEDIYVVGGGRVYRELCDLCDTAYVTKIDYTYTADTFCPNLDLDPAWRLDEESEEQTCFDIAYTYCTYKRI